MEQEIHFCNENGTTNDPNSNHPDSKNSTSVEISPIFAAMSAEKINSLGIYPNPELNLLAAGTGTGSLSIWFSGDLETDPEGHVWTCQPHLGSIEKVGFKTGNANKLMTSGQDGFVRILDLKEQKMDLVSQRNQFQDFSKILDFQQIDENRVSQILTHSTVDLQTQITRKVHLQRLQCRS